MVDLVGFLSVFMSGVVVTLIACNALLIWVNRQLDEAIAHHEMAQALYAQSLDTARDD